MVVISVCVTQDQVRAGKREEEAGRAGSCGDSLDPGTEDGGWGAHGLCQALCQPTHVDGLTFMITL